LHQDSHKGIKIQLNAIQFGLKIIVLYGGDLDKCGAILTGAILKWGDLTRYRNNPYMDLQFNFINIITSNILQNTTNRKRLCCELKNYIWISSLLCLIDWCLTSSEQFFSYIQDENMFTVNQYVGWKRGTDRPMGKQI